MVIKMVGLWYRLRGGMSLNEALGLWQSLFQRDLEKQPPVDRVMFRTASRHDKVCSMIIPPFPGS